MREQIGCAIGHHWPLARGADRLLPVLGQLLPTSGERIVTMRNGLKIKVDLADRDGRELALFGVQELATVRACRWLLEPGYTMLVIGANHGAVGFACADRCADLVFVEPNPTLANRIRSVRRLNQNPPKYRLFEAALSDFNGTAELEIPVDRSGMGSIVAGRHYGQAVACRTVDVFSTAEFLGELRDAPIGCVVDIEGTEAKVVPALLRDPRVRFVVFERGDELRDAMILQIAREQGFVEKKHTVGDVLVVRA